MHNPFNFKCPCCQERLRYQNAALVLGVPFLIVMALALTLAMCIGHFYVDTFQWNTAEMIIFLVLGYFLIVAGPPDLLLEQNSFPGEIDQFIAVF